MSIDNTNKITELSVDITYDCIFRCPFCSSYNLHGELRDSIIREVQYFAYIISLKDEIRPIITIGGGEPLINKNLLNILEKWKDISSQIKIYSTLSFPYPEDFWKSLYSKKLTTIIVSIPSTRCDLQEEIFGPLYSWRHVYRNILNLVDIGLDIHVNFLLTRLNINEFDAVYQFCIENGISTLRILALSPQGLAQKNWASLYVGKILTNNFIKKVSGLNKNPKIKIQFSGFPELFSCVHSTNKIPCLGGIKYFHINVNGDIFPCPSLKTKQDKCIGNIHFINLNNINSFHQKISSNPYQIRCQVISEA